MGEYLRECEHRKNICKNIMAKKKTKKHTLNPYKYDATILRVIDGDTFVFEIDLGFSIKVKDTLRLYGVNTPEKRGKEKLKGLAVKEYVQSLIEGKTFEIDVYKKGKFGRYIADVYLSKRKKLSKHLLQKKMAKKIDY